WETIPRSLATTFITMLPITALYFFGGETLKDFAFALLVGIGAGAYSSIFIAAPLVAARPTPDLIPDVLQGDGDGAAVPAADDDSAAAKRERRRQRRSTRPHGR